MRHFAGIAIAWSILVVLCISPAQAGPTVVAMDPPAYTSLDVSAITLDLSDPVVLEDANDPATYTLLDLGADRLPGGGNDTDIIIAPSYLSGTTQIQLLVVGDNTINLNAWHERDYQTGGSGDWRIEQEGESVKQYKNGYVTFYVSDFDLIDRQFRGRIKVETTSDDDFIGLAFAYSEHPDTNRPDSYYLITWKRLAQSVSGNYADQGFKLLKITNSAATPYLDIYHKIWGGEDWEVPDGCRMQKLASRLGSGTGWASNVEYEFSFRYESNGRINVVVRRTSNGAIMWNTTYIDPEPLGPGKVAFFNMSQQSVRYSGLQQAGFLPEGAYQLTAVSGDPGLRGTDESPLDGDGDGQPGGNFVAAFVVDQTPPAVAHTAIATGAISVTWHEIGGMDEAAAADQANFTITSSGGDGIFDNGNDIPITPSNVAFDAVTNTTTLSFDPPLQDELYSLTINGTSGVKDAAGHALLNGDYNEELVLETVPPMVAIEMQEASDSGASPTDNLTNVKAPVFDVTINKPGVVSIDLEGDGSYEAHLCSTSGTYDFASSVLADNTYTAAVTFTPALGPPVADALEFTIDTRGPAALPGAPSEQAPMTQRQVVFDEEIDPATVSPDDFLLSGPSGIFVPESVSGTGTTFTVAFDMLLTGGIYVLSIGPDICDVAGNPMNQDGDDTNGEQADACADAFELIADETAPAIVAHTPSGVQQAGVATVRVTFDGWILAETFDGGDVAISTPAGAVDPAQITVLPVIDPQTPDLHDEFDVQFPAQTADGACTFEIGPGITDISGNPMDAAWQGGFSIDAAPPVTTAATQPSVPNGLDGWFITQPAVKLNAADAGIGVKEIHYWWNEEPETIRAQASASIPAPAGINTLHFYAVDLFDQAEAPQQLQVKHDVSNPSVNIELSGTLAGPDWYSSDVTATIIPDGDGVEVISIEYRTNIVWSSYTSPVVISGEGSHTIHARVMTERGKIAVITRNAFLATLEIENGNQIPLGSRASRPHPSFPALLQP